MKAEIRKKTIVSSLAATLFVFSSCSSTPESPPAVGTARMSYTKGVPGGVLVQTVKVTATVAEIDQAKRQATFQGTDGQKFTVKIGRAVASFDQIHVGDKVTAVVTQKVRISLDEREPKPIDSRSKSSGEEAMQLTARVIALNSDKRTATLQFDGGNTQTISIRDDVDPSRHKVGDQVTFRITEMTASWIEKSQ